MAKPDPNPNIPKINLYQKQRVCFVVSDKGEEFLVELLPKVKVRRKPSSIPSSQPDSSKIEQRREIIKQRELFPDKRESNNEKASDSSSPSPNYKKMQKDRRRRSLANILGERITIEMLVSLCYGMVGDDSIYHKICAYKLKGEQIEMARLLINHFECPEDQLNYLIESCIDEWSDKYSKITEELRRLILV